ncbi:MAG TPA: hypothetical protein ENJ95_22280 [Bacteroidetes bacterium]|nr:hypothetical protein [Bacteroidota bacterium]
MGRIRKIFQRFWAVPKYKFHEKKNRRNAIAKYLAFSLFSFFISINIASAQTPSTDTLPPPDSSQTKYINIRYADELKYFATGQDTVQKLIGQVEMNQDTMFLFCDSAIIVNSTEMVAEGNFVLQQGDSTTIFADSAEYSSNTKTAELYGNVSMLKGRQKLFTEQLSYDADTKIATYLTGATMTDDTTYLKSTRGYFHARTDDIFFKDSVVVASPDFTLRSDTLQFNARTKIVTFLAPTLIVQDTAKIYTESGFYDINLKKAQFDKNPQYLKNDQKAWADTLLYDGNTKEVTLLGNAHFEDSTSVATANIIRHNETTGVTVLMGKGFFHDEERTLTGDTISYNSKNETYSTRGRSHIVDGDQILDADQVDYIKERELGIAVGNVVFTDTTQKMTVICEYAENSKKRNFLKAFGGRDSLGRPSRPLLIKEIDGDSIFISADTLISFNPRSSLQSSVSSTQSAGSQSLVEVDSTGLGGTFLEGKDSVGLAGTEVVDTVLLERPLDSIPIAVANKMAEESGQIAELIEKPNTPPDSLEAKEIDTPLLDLLDEMIPEKDTTDQITQNSKLKTQNSPTQNSQEERIILAYNDVRIYKSDLQALCDSLAYSSADSLFKLFDEPIIWSDTSQFTADHIDIQLANNAIDRIFMKENSFIVNSPDELFFNQIKGRNSTAFFRSGELRNVRVVGNAESVYYALDDDRAYIGVNKTLCSEMKILFGNNEVEGIVFYAQPKANLFPMKDADHEALKLEGFSWQIGRRPGSVQEIIELKKGGNRKAAPIQAIKKEGFEEVKEIIEKGKD